MDAINLINSFIAKQDVKSESKSNMYFDKKGEKYEQ